MIIDPTAVTEIVFPINEDLSIHYTTFRDEYVFVRPAGSWRTWRQLPFIPPVGNSQLKQKYDDGTKFGCCEHVSLILSGSATYTLITDSGTTDYTWGRGSHNVDNGLGYLPTEQFTRKFHDGFSMCCIIQPIRGLTDSPLYSFEIVTGNATITRDAYAVHICGSESDQRTIFDVHAGSTLNASSTDYAIVVYKTDSYL